MTGTDIRERVRARALAEGFDAVGFCEAALGGAAKRDLAGFLAAGHHGDMGWLAANSERRGDIGALWPEARSAVVVAQNYGPAGDPLAALERRDRGTVSVYAQGRDYHDVMKKKLRAVARWMHEALGCEVKLFVDTAPVMEKPLAQKGGIGWQGKHTNLVSREFGSWLFLGEILTTLALAPDPPETDRCGTCRRCLDICPTGAFPAPYRLDATRCISYLTIEHKGHIAQEFRAAIGNRIYGCDDCLAVCPWNKFARRAGEPLLFPLAALAAPRLAELAALDDAAFRALFSGSAVKRLGRDRFLRNVMIAIGNSGEPGLAATAEAALADASPLVRAMAVWALSRLLPADAFARLRARHRGREADAAVRAEWGG
ncbi:MAG: tRNA epoxyqueuosine(34) reductase QueG [Defluviicoccus sp.]|nr:tRNA epoxyqueuosine(34) reductase QueG [Defluviicoccus sp.]MDE0386390.1 tRNA epoxyqueuosine(34) reductase QueG [Defluviicoccus sp.]